MTESVVGPWAQDKLERLRKYLHAYTSIMKEQSWCKDYYYIDAFAGPGHHELRGPKSGPHYDAQQILLEVASYVSEQEEQTRFLAGSPRVALNLQFPFTRYVFVERAADRIAALNRLKIEYGAIRNIRIHKEDCTKYLRDKIALNAKLTWKSNRAIVFLDPFGMQVGWQTIADLAKTGAVEVFLNFPVGMAIQRLLPRDHRKFTHDDRARLTGYFGSPDWEGLLYKRRATLPGFFDDDGATGEQEKIDQSGQALLKWYRDRLRTVFKHVSKAALIRNTQGGHLYYLLLASHNKTGVKIANEILSAGETI